MALSPSGEIRIGELVGGVQAAVYYALASILNDPAITKRLSRCGAPNCRKFILDFAPKPRKHCNEAHRRAADFHYLRPGANRAGLENPGPQEWVRFLDDTGISCSVLYPTFGLAVGRFVSEHWAIAACRAYNNWLHEKFTSKNSRLKGMALLPIQDVEAAALELRRAVKELGMLGGMLPSNGEGIKNHLGAKVYWPLYAEAEKLGSSLAVHVGSLHHLVMDGFSTYYPVHALGHPFGITIQAAGMLAHGIFERFPKLRVAFLEGGSTWVPFFLDRLDRPTIGVISRSTWKEI
jgi:predicted TIM-barrel fold metal-dependent hydrolase